jgi:hypothetical protein
VDGADEDDDDVTEDAELGTSFALVSADGMVADIEEEEEEEEQEEEEAGSADDAIEVAGWLV